MKYLSILEKFKILFDTLMSFKFIFVLVILMLILTILFTCKKLSNKKYVIFMSLSMILTFIISIIRNHKVLFNTFDNFTTIFFNGIYFPSIYIYISVLLIISLAFITSILNSKKKKIYKIINSITFIINNIFFVIILNIIAKNSINVFEMSSLYTNNSLVAILELNMGLFILWVTALSVVYITNTICDKITSKKTVKEEVTIKDIDEEISTTKELLPKEKIVFNEDVTKIPEVIQTIEEVSSDTNIETNGRVTFNDILNGLVPVTYYDNEINNQNYNITNPQEIYEGNYNNLKLELEKNTIKKVESIIDKISEVKEVEDVPKVKIEKIEKVPEIKVNIIKTKDIINNDTLNINLDTVEDKTLKIKKENMKKNLISNTISLNDLIKQDEEIKETSKVIDTINDESYSLNDYKKIVEMLKEIKNNSNKNNISIDDAVTMSLINNYSIDDCVKFKEILESNLN
ncbi:MAG: hypothetical protein SOT91_03850 [Bacilli bacterium]|nr:hypothetical protein [Bacilli bacterium]